MSGEWCLYLIRAYVDILSEGSSFQSSRSSLLRLPGIDQGGLGAPVVFCSHNALRLADPHGSSPRLIQTEEVFLMELLVAVTVAGSVVVEPLRPQAGVGLVYTQLAGRDKTTPLLPFDG